MTNQSRSVVGRDQIGTYTDNSDNRTVNTILPRNHTAISALTVRLEQEVREKLVASDIVPSLSFYRRRREAKDGIAGLEAKLEAGDREFRIEEALELKVEFDKILDKWSLYTSAQEIFGHLLAIISRKFSNKILKYHQGELVGYTVLTFDEDIDDHILLPIVDQCGEITHFQVNLDLTLGMLYWLADNCFVRWHK